MSIKVGKVGMVPIKDIIVSERARKEMGDLEKLEGSMKESGLIQPLAMYENSDGSYLLLAGGRRFAILAKNNVPLIPARIYDYELSEIEIKIIEKAENFFRKDFEYWELDELTADIHRMQQELHGVKAPGPNQEGWGSRDTAEIIGAKSPASVTVAIRRHEARDAFPELFENCKTASDASKVLKKIDEAMVKQVIAQKLEQHSSNSSINQLAKCFIVKDFFEGVKEIPDGVMHLVEIDPPYGIDIKAKKRKADDSSESHYVLEDYNEIDAEDYQAFLANTFRECYRVMTQHSWLVCWFGPEPWFEIVYRELRNAGFETNRMCGIWAKNIPGQSMSPATRLSNSYEMFFYAWKGQPALNKPGRGNLFNYSVVPANQKTHPTERPIDLTTEIYNTFAFQGSRILIPFLGSGNGLISASQLGMSAIGFDLAKSHKDSFLVKVHGIK